MSNVQVYQDIINLIIDDVAASYHDAASVKNHPLLSCALVCRSFHLRTTHHIFSRLEIAQSCVSSPGSPDETSNQKIVRLADILRGNAAIGPSVRTLIIQETSKALPQTTYLECRLWEKENHALTYLLRQLSALQQLVIRSYGRLPWNMGSGMHHEHVCALRDIISASSLLHLEIHGPCLLPPEIIFECLHIKHVTFRSIQVCDIPEGFPTTVGCLDSYSTLPLVLESARLCFCVPAINLLLSVPTNISVFSHLRKLQVHIQTEEDIWPSWCVMFQAASTLELLDLAWGGYVAMLKISPTAINLAELPSLRHFKFTCHVYPQLNPPDYLHQILDLRGLDSNIETIHIITNWRHVESILWIQGSYQWWDRMDTALSSGGYKHLRQIVLYESRVPDFKPNFFLPGVLAMGNVSVETGYLPGHRASMN